MNVLAEGFGLNSIALTFNLVAADVGLRGPVSRIWLGPVGGIRRSGM